MSYLSTVTEEDHNASLIEKARIIFRPGRILAGALSSLSFTKVAVKYPKDAEEEEEDTSGEVDEGGMD